MLSVSDLYPYLPLDIFAHVRLCLSLVWLFRLPVATMTTTMTMCPGVTMVLVGVLNMNMIDCGLGGVVPTNVANSGSK